MKLTDALTEIQGFIGVSRQLFPNLALTIPRALDVKVFPDEWDLVKPPTSGMYLLVSNPDQELFYVGITVGIARRVYQHIGPGFSWARNGRQCAFPNVSLERPWLSNATQSILRSGDFLVQPTGVTPFECSALLEAFLVARAFVKEGRRPEINVEF